MSMRKVVTKNGEIKYEVRLHKDGRKSKRVTQRFDRKTDADAVHAELKTQFRELRSTVLASRGFDETTFKAESDFWLLRKRQKFSPSHVKRVEGILKEILPRFGPHTPDRFTIELMCDFQDEQLRLKKKAATINRKTEVIAAILNFSVKNRHIPFNPCNGYEKLSAAREGVSFWELKEAEAFLAFTNNKYPEGSPFRWVYVVYLDALNTAKRAGEIWGLRPSDFIHGGELQYIQRQYDRVKGDFGPLKWNMPPRMVPCNLELREELKGLIKTQKIAQNRTVFAKPDGSPICHETFVRSFYDKDVAEAGMRRIRFHDLRHTGTTFLVAAGHDPKTVMEICGHKDLKTTMGYVHLVGDKIKHIARTHAVSGKNTNNHNVVSIKEPEDGNSSSFEFGSALTIG